VWHEDLGFRKNRILNPGILVAQSEFLIFIDGDCIQHPEFVRECVLNRAEQTVLSGRRTELSPWVTQKLTPQKIREGYMSRNLWWILISIMHRAHAEAGKGLYMRDSWLRRKINQRPRPLVGCNFAGNKIDFENVNGFDIRYEGIGAGEDSDIDFRLGLSGVRIKSMVNAAVQFHLWHPFLKRPSVNEGMFNEVIAKKNPRAQLGLAEMKAELEKSSGQTQSEQAQGEQK
jgi:glycosyltransferase involved in cell wall biosynthesis